MSENTKVKVSENVKGDSTKQVDVETKIIPIEERIIPGNYKMITELSIDEIKALPRFKVVISCKERVYNGQVSYYPSLTLCLGNCLDLSTKKDDFTVISFTELKENHLVPNLGMDVKADTFEGYFPVRFCKGRKEIKGEISEFYYAQIVIKKGKVYSTYINKKGGAFDLFVSRVNKGMIKFDGWTFNDKVKSANVDPEDDDYIYE